MSITVTIAISWLMAFATLCIAAFIRSERAARYGAMGHVWRKVRGLWQWELKSNETTALAGKE